MRILIAILAILAGVAVCSASADLQQGRIITVDDDGPPADFDNIQAAINDANDGDTVIVADGTYKGPGNRDIDFNGLAITVCSENGPINCIIDCNGSESDPHRGFYFHSWERNDSVLRGFTIAGGYQKYGGGIKCWDSGPKIVNCTFRSNTAYISGGAIHIYGRSRGVEIVNSLFYGNTAEGTEGVITADACCNAMSVNITNCTLHSNSGTAIRLKGGYGDHLMVCNTIIWYNSWHLYWSPCGFCGRPTLFIKYSLLQSNWPGTGIIVADPCFADPGYWADVNDLSIVVEPDDPNAVWVDGDYHLKSQAGRWDPNSQSWVIDDVTSPCIDRGDPMSPIGLEPFPNGGIINMGAYGGTAEASKSYFGKPPCEVIVAGDINGDCIIDFRDFWFMALHWMEDRN